MTNPLVPPMRVGFTVDREILQAVLASAFAIQQSQMDSKSRSAIVEVGRLVTNGELDVDGAMHRIVAQTRKAANTGGVATDPPLCVQLSLPGIEEANPSSGLAISESTPSTYNAWVEAADISLDPPAAQQAHVTEASAAASALMCAEELVRCDSTGMSAPRIDEPPSAVDRMDALIGALGVVPPQVTTRYRAPWKPMLMILAIALVLLLGWMLGRVAWLGTAHPKGPPLPLVAKPSATPAQPEEASQADAISPPSFHERSRRHETSPDNLVVYDHGRVVFRLKSPQAHGDSSREGARLFQRVEPEYPEAAKQQHIQGPVVLEANVDEGGTVEQLTVVSGNPILANAASDAVLKWRFKPLVQDGQAVSFKTRVKVDFVLR